MDWSGIWVRYGDGTMGAGPALLSAGGAAFAVLVLGLPACRALVRSFSRGEPAKALEGRLSRLTLGAVLLALSAALAVYLHGVTSPAARHGRLLYGVAHLLLTFCAGYLLLEVALGFFADFLPGLRRRPASAPIVKDLVRTVFLAGVLFLAVKQGFPEADIGALLTTSAILSVVIGLALQESLSNVFAGLMLTIDRPFKPGDWIEVDGNEGRVLDSNWRSTRIRTPNDDVIYVPNSTMAKSNIVNLSDPTPTHLCRLKVGLVEDVSPNRVKSVVVPMMLRVEGVLADPPPDAHVLDYGDSCITYELRFFVSDLLHREFIQSEVNRALWYTLKRAGIGFSTLIREVHLRRDREGSAPDANVELLRKVDLLRPLKEEELLQLAGDLGVELFARGESVCRQGEDGSTFYIIRSGQIGVRAKGDGAADEVEVARLGPGSYFGEMSLLAGAPRSSTCVALEDSELLCLNRESFGVLIRDNPAVALSMSDIIASRVEATKVRLNQERETMIRTRGADQAKAAQGILDKIATIFRFRR